MEKIEINTATFLKYKHVAEFIAEHDKKCNYFLKKIHPESEPSLLIAHPSILLILQGKEVLPKKVLDGLDVKHVEIDISTTDLKTHKTEKNACKPIIKVKQKSNDRQNVSVEFVQKGDFKGVKSKNTKFMHLECSSDEFISKIGLLLEQLALKQFETKIEQLRRIKEEIANNDISGGQTLKKRKLSIDLTTLRSGKSFHPSTENAHGGESIVLDEMEREVLTDTIRSGEALFRRRGYTTEAQEKYPVLTDEVSNGIFSIDQRIRGCGYRSRILNIFVDEQDVEKQLQISKSIEITLRKYNIVDFEVVFGLYQVQLLSGYVAGCEVVKNGWKSGTLGGYTQCHNQTYGLLARHFVELDIDTSPEESSITTATNETAGVYSRGDNNSVTKFGEVVRCQTRGAYDLSAAKMLVDIQEKRLRNATGEHVPSNLVIFDAEKQDLWDERPVYIWAKGETLPRQGKIAFPFFKQHVLKEHYVLIEDTSVLDSETNTFRWNRLCESGQSGAIFCSDEPDGTCAHVISMLQGTYNFNEVDANPKKKGLYMSFGLHEGLEQLKRDTGVQLELC